MPPDFDPQTQVAEHSHWSFAPCWLARFAPDDQLELADCDGPMTRAHLVPQQEIRRSIATTNRFNLWQDKRDGPISVTRACKDKRLMVPACWKHHHLLDVARKIRLTRTDLPSAVEEAAAEYGLLAWLDREYGVAA